MPLYEYQCGSCGHRFEVIQKFSDAPLESCPRCGGAVRKLMSSPAFQFKGSGWYITDYARKDTKETKEAKEGKEGGEAKDTKPAAETKDTKESKESKHTNTAEKKPAKTEKASGGDPSSSTSSPSKT